MTTNDQDEIFKDDGTFIEKFKCKCGNRDNWDDYYLCTECQSPAKFVQHGREAERQRIWAILDNNHLIEASQMRYSTIDITPDELKALIFGGDKK